MSQLGFWYNTGSGVNRALKLKLSNFLGVGWLEGRFPGSVSSSSDLPEERLWIWSIVSRPKGAWSFKLLKCSIKILRFMFSIGLFIVNDFPSKAFPPSKSSNSPSSEEGGCIVTAFLKEGEWLLLVLLFLFGFSSCLEQYSKYFTVTGLTSFTDEKLSKKGRSFWSSLSFKSPSNLEMRIEFSSWALTCFMLSYILWLTSNKLCWGLHR